MALAGIGGLRGLDKISEKSSFLGLPPKYLKAGVCPTLVRKSLTPSDDRSASSRSARRRGPAEVEESRGPPGLGGLPSRLRNLPGLPRLRRAARARAGVRELCCGRSGLWVERWPAGY